MLFPEGFGGDVTFEMMPVIPLQPGASDVQSELREWCLTVICGPLVGMSGGPGSRGNAASCADGGMYMPLCARLSTLTFCYAC